MPFWRLNYQLIWGTKNRLPLITPQIEERLYSFIIDKAISLGVQVHAING